METIKITESKKLTQAISNQKTLKNTQNAMKTAFSGSRALYEAELREMVDNFTYEFSPEYQDVLNINQEFFLNDTRPFRNADTRRLDSLFMTPNGVCVVEFKRGVLTETEVTECGFGRGYFQLCYEQIPNFSNFLFVAEEIKPALGICRSIKTPKNVSVKCVTYSTLILIHLHEYMVWSKANREPLATTMQNVLDAKKHIPDTWLTESQLKAAITLLIS